jgi:hypothetical protein
VGTKAVKPIIALDADGVFLDYHLAYRAAWSKAFGVEPALRDPLAYWPIDRWDVKWVEGDDLTRFRDCFNHQFWSSIPPVAGAVEACHSLSNAGYELVCVSAIEARFQTARLQNLRDIGFPIERVFATSNAGTAGSPKADALRMLQPIAFVDDFLPYLCNIPSNIHAALILREPNGKPNAGNDLVWAQSQHADLVEFAAWWLAIDRPAESSQSDRGDVG